MLEKFLNKKVFIWLANYASAGLQNRKGTVTNVDENFVELDNNELVAIKYIASIEQK